MLNSTQENTTTTTISDCESCYGAESDAHKCCPTCDDVKSAYRVKDGHLMQVSMKDST